MRGKNQVFFDGSNSRRHFLLLGEDFAVDGIDGAIVGAVNVAGERAGDGAVDVVGAGALLPFRFDDDGDAAGAVGEQAPAWGEIFFLDDAGRREDIVDV